MDIAVPKLGPKTTEEDVISLKKTEIQLFLRVNKLKTTGNKQELVSRVLCHVRASGEDESVVSLSDVDDVNKLDAPEYDTLTTGWTSDTSMLPVPSHKDVENYLINSRHRTVDHNQMKCYRQYIRGYNFYKEKYIHKIMCNTIDDNSSLVYVRSKCFPSMKKGVYVQWVLMTKEAPIQVVKANCTCPAGLGEGCTHVAGLLFALENRGSKSETLPEIACTSKPCQWNKPSKRKHASKEITNISFKWYKYDAVPTCTQSVPRKEKKTKISVNQMNFRERLCNKLTDRNAVIFDLQDPPTKQTEDDIINDLNVACFEEVETIEHITYPSDRYININQTVKNESLSEDNLIDLVTNIPATIIDEIEQRTRGQHDNVLWKESRKSRITASIFHDIKTRKESTPADKLVEKILGNGKELPEIDALQWGIKNEPIAKRCYKATKKLKFKETVFISEKGLYLCKTCSYLGASPDGLVKSGTGEFLIEVKCPYQWRNTTVLDACKAKTFYCFVDENSQIKLKSDHRYYTQIQGQLAVCGYEKCELVISTKRDLQIIEVFFDQPFWGALLLKMKTFYMKYIVPAVLNQ